MSATQADYVYIFVESFSIPDSTNPSTTSEALRFKVLKHGVEIGLMTIYHSNSGAYAHFIDTTE